MATTKHASNGRNGATGKSRPKGIRGKAQLATLETKLRRYVQREEARGAYRHFRDPAKALAELRKRTKKSRHALRTAAA